MSTTQRRPDVQGYLDELRRLLGAAPEADLVVEGVARHIEDALADGPVDDARVQAVLDELGDPATIAAEATPAPASAAAPAPFLERWSGAILTVVLLSIGGIVVPVAGWIVGLGLLWFSHGWTRLDKVVGTVAPVVFAGIGLGLPVLFGASGAHVGLLVGFAVGIVAVPIYLLLRFRPAR